jgi:hypothetical protein
MIKHFRNFERLPDHTHSDPAPFKPTFIPFFILLETSPDKSKLVPLEECEILACLAGWTRSSEWRQLTNLGTC